MRNAVIAIGSIFIIDTYGWYAALVTFVIIGLIASIGKLGKAMMELEEGADHAPRGHTHH